MKPEQAESLIKRLLNDPGEAPAIFITGQAGTGKSTLIKKIRAMGLPNLVVVAPTGVAALNVAGATIHSFFGFKPKILTEKEVKDTPISDVHQNLSYLVIDEVSMVSPDIIDAIDVFLRRARKDKSKPFGGVRVIFVGDLLQLEPVINDQPDARKWFFSKYASPGFFEAEVFSSHKVLCVRLSENFRQKDDSKFLKILSEIRSGRVSTGSLNELNRRYVKVERDDYITLCATNEEVRSINEEMLDSIEGEPECFESEATGSFVKIKEDERGTKLPAPRILILKKGARVLMLRNDPHRRWVNGSMGEIVDFDDEHVKVRVDNDDDTYSVDRVSWESYEYRFDEKKKTIESYVVGMFTQFPLSLGWAITIHKAQGKTLDAVKINIREGTRLSLPGQIYVAFSRCRALENLSISRKLSSGDFSEPKSAAAQLWNAIVELKEGHGSLDFSQFNGVPVGTPIGVSSMPTAAVTHLEAIRALIDRAIDEELYIRMGYRNGDGIYSDRVVRPFSWTDRNRFTAMCSLHEYEERMFAVSRIEWAIVE